jgi:hypothetical protein
MRDQRSHPWHKLVAPMDLEAFLDWFDGRPANHDQQCGFLTPERAEDAAFRVLSERFLIAGTVERLAAFDHALSGILGTTIRTPVHNRSRRPIDPGSVPAATLERILAMHPQDVRLHRRVLEAELVGTALARAGLDQGPSNR